MVKQLVVLFMLLSLNGFSFVHTYIFVKPNYGMGGEIEFYMCEENPYTYTMTYDGASVTISDFPMVGQNGVKTFTFTAVEISSSTTYTFSADIDFNGSNPSITYNTQPAVLPLSVIETFMPPTGSCDGQINLIINGGYNPVNVNWVQPSTLVGNNPTSLCSGTYQYSVSDNYSFCSMGTPLVRTLQLDDMTCQIFVDAPTCPDECDGMAQLFAMAGNNSIIMQEIMEMDNSTTNPFMLDNLCADNNLTGFLYHLSGQQAFCMGTVVGPDDLVFSLDTNHVTTQGANDGSATVNISSGASPHTYAWSGPNGFTASGSSVSNLEDGTYVLSIGFNNGCDSTITFQIEDGVNTSYISELDKNIRVFPQPVNEILTIKSSENLQEIVIYNALGAIIYSNAQLNSNNTVIDCSGFESGIYFMKITDQNANTSTRKIIKQ